MDVTAARAAGERSVPCLACTTIWSLSPAWAGKSVVSTCWAFAESVPVSEALFEYADPVRLLRLKNPIRAISHTARTAFRCRKHQRAKPAIALSPLGVSARGPAHACHGGQWPRGCRR